MNDTFSTRLGYREVVDAEIRVREDAPYELRGAVVRFAFRAGLRPDALRQVVCDILLKRPDADNWSPENVEREIQRLVDEASWYRVYDIVEAVAAALVNCHYCDAPQFEQDLNDYFREAGIGWKLTNGRVETRGPEGVEEAIRDAVMQLADSELTRAHQELHEALRDLSRRPQPDATGAIQHGMAALECVAREACGDQNATLGDILKWHPGLVPKPLDEALAKVWGYASNEARHVREGRPPPDEEARLVVGLAAAAIAYLATKLKGRSTA